jgi:hypothetical protein
MNEEFIKSRAPKRAVYLSLLISCLIIEYILFSQFWGIRISNFILKTELARQSMQVLIVLTLIAHYRLPGRVQQIFDVVVYMFAAIVAVRFILM